MAEIQLNGVCWRSDVWLHHGKNVESKVSLILALFPAQIMVIPLAFNIGTWCHFILGHFSRNKSETSVAWLCALLCASYLQTKKYHLIYRVQLLCPKSKIFSGFTWTYQTCRQQCAYQCLFHLDSLRRSRNSWHGTHLLRLVQTDIAHYIPRQKTCSLCQTLAQNKN